jgi:hypothetical protein
MLVDMLAIAPRVDIDQPARRAAHHLQAIALGKRLSFGRLA